MRLMQCRGMLGHAHAQELSHAGIVDQMLLLMTYRVLLVASRAHNITCFTSGGFGTTAASYPMALRIGGTINGMTRPGVGKERASRQFTGASAKDGAAVQ